MFGSHQSYPKIISQIIFYLQKFLYFHTAVHKTKVNTLEEEIQKSLTRENKGDTLTNTDENMKSR